MGYRTLIETWVGMSWAEITDNWKPPAKKEDYEAAVEGEKNKLANAIWRASSSVRRRANLTR